MAGWALGGTIGIGTIVFALGIGPIVQVLLGVFDPTGRTQRRRERTLEADVTGAE